MAGGAGRSGSHPQRCGVGGGGAEPCERCGSASSVRPSVLPLHGLSVPLSGRSTLPPTHLSICPALSCLSKHFPVRLPVHPSVHPPVCPSIHPPIHYPIHPSHPPLHPSTHPPPIPVRPSIHPIPSHLPSSTFIPVLPAPPPPPPHLPPHFWDVSSTFSQGCDAPGLTGRAGPAAPQNLTAPQAPP